MIRFNGIGLGMLFGSALVALILSTILKSQEAISIITASALMIVADLAYRARQPERDGTNKWLATKSGGFIALGPVWVMGILLISYGVLVLSGIVPQ